MFASLRTARSTPHHAQSRMHSGGIFKRLAAPLRRAYTLRRERQALARLDDHILADIGLSRAEALAESARPLWDAPKHWRS